MKWNKNKMWWGVACLAIALVVVVVWLLRVGFSVNERTRLYVDADDTADSVEVKVAPYVSRGGRMAFRLFAKALDLDEHVHTGCYEVSAETTVLRLLRNIRNHQATPVRLVVPSVRTLGDMAAKLSNQLMVDSVDVARMFGDVEFVRSLGYTRETLPALFVPNTYEVYWDVSVQDLLERMKQENDRFWNEERRACLDEVSQYAGEEMTKEKVATLASIVDGETANNGEKPIIAALYMNRLRQGMPLQSDPTVIFAIGDFGIRRVRHDHLVYPSPYNTYLHKGLPPGPIRVPSVAGIDAVLHHDKNAYVYMCAKEDFSGTHNYAVTYAEHLRNAARYTKALNERNIH